MPPNVALKGTYSTRLTGSVGIPDEDEPQDRMMILAGVQISANALTTKEEVQKLGPKSFEIDIQAEALFKSEKGIAITRSGITNDLARALSAQVFPLVMNHVRTYAADMGFRGVRPELGVALGKLSDVDENLKLTERPASKSST